MSSYSGRKSNSSQHRRTQATVLNVSRSTTSKETATAHVTPEANIQDIRVASNEDVAHIKNLSGLKTQSQLTTGVRKARLAIFSENVIRQAGKIDLPKIGARIDSTPQLVLCSSLLPMSQLTQDRGGQDQANGTLQDIPTDRTHLDWIKAIEMDNVEQDHIRWLGKLQYAPEGCLDADDLVKILSILRRQLQNTHQQSTEHAYHLTLAVSRLLDVMAEHKVYYVSREEEHEPLSEVLTGLRSSPDPHLVYQASYAFQALQYIPNDETALHAVLRRGTFGAIKSSYEGIRSLVDSGRAVLDSGRALLNSGRALFDALEGGVTTGHKRSWYPALRGADALLRYGEVINFSRLIVEAPCRRDPLFQWGISQLLGDFAVDEDWEVVTRQQAMDLLVDLYSNDMEWAQDAAVKDSVLGILAKLLKTSEPAIKNHAKGLMHTMKMDGYPGDTYPYPLKAGLPKPRSSPLLARVQEIPCVEYKTHRLRRQRLEEVGQPIYVPLMAKSSLQAPDSDMFPLMEKVTEFLASERQAMLIVGDSGTGKSTFNRHLECALWRAYESAGQIPLFINISALSKPESELIEEQLRIYKFAEAEIMELKQHRQLIVICDGFDESQLTTNIHTTNQLNQPGQWNVKLVVSCRSLYLGREYRDLFVPQGSGHYSAPALHKFQEAVITPFSRSQIEDFVKQYLPLEPGPWRTEDYMGKLTSVPGVMDVVKNPFLLSLSLRALRSVIKDKMDLAPIRITRVALYDSFVKHWIEANLRRLLEQRLGRNSQAVLAELAKDFVRNGVEYHKDLAAAIYQKQDGKPFVDYIHKRDKLSWKAKFFGPEPEPTLLRTCSLLSRIGNHYQFFDGSILDYFYSRYILEPSRGDFDFNLTGRFDTATSTQSIANHPLSQRKFVNEPSLIKFLCEHVQEDAVYREHLHAILDYFKTNPDPSQAASNAITILLGAATAVQPIADHPLSHRNLVGEPSMIKFLCKRVQEDVVYKEHLHAILDYSKTDAYASQAASNAVTVLVRARVIFNGADLQGVRVSGADLRGGQFDSAQLQGADLRNTNLHSTWLRQANLSNAQMAGVQFGEWPLLEEEHEVGGCAYSSDGETFAVGLGSGAISMYRSATWEKTSTLSGHTSYVRSVAFSLNGQQIASGSSDRTVRLWNTKTGTLDATLRGHASAVTSVMFSPDSQLIASGSSDNTVRLWNAQTGAVCSILIGHTDSATSVVFSPSGQQIASGSWDKSVRLWDAQTGAECAILRGHTKEVMSVVFSPSGELIASSSRDKTVRLWNSQTGLPGAILNGHTHWVTSAVFSPSGHQIVSGSFDKTVRLWDAQTGSPVAIFSGHASYVMSVAYSPSGRQVTSGSFDKTVRLWDAQVDIPEAMSSSLTDYATCVVISPSGQQIASASYDKTVRFWDAQTGAPGAILRGHTSAVMGVVFSPNGQLIATGSRDNSVRLWDAKTGAPGVIFSGHTADTMSVAFSPSGQQIASGSYDNTVRLWDAQTGAAGSILRGHTDSVTSVVFSPSGQQIASGSFDKTVRLWDAQTCLSGATLKGHSSSIMSVAFSPSGQRVASGSFDKTVRLWDAQTAAPIAILNEHTDYVRSVVFSPSGQQIASGSDDHTVRLWDAASGRCLTVVKDFHGPISSIAWGANRDNTHFATACGDSSVRLWQVIGDRHIVSLLWSSMHDRLVVSDTIIFDAQDLSTANMKFLKQRGALSQPTL
ncbi:hypothetical protein BGZ72_004452 [Mortierella alpina]|nr:hypothetical protein BGZ72_004452 [Mortierella alpina]